MRPAIRTPRAHGELACDPPLAELTRLLGEKVRPKAAQDDWQKELRALARLEFSQTLSQNGFAPEPGRPWVGTGHQPELFHPGVWAKNFIAGGMGAFLNNASLNVVIDTDSPREMGIRLPDLAMTDHPRRSRLCLFSKCNTGTPWAKIQKDPVLLETFSHALKAWSGQTSFSPLATQWLANFEKNESVYLKSPAWSNFHLARTGVEKAWGLCQSSLPMSQISGFRSFHRLIRRFLKDNQRARAAYNQALATFRAYHQVATPGRPVPCLEERKDGWGEAPLWIVRDGSGNRERLWIKKDQDTYLLASAPNHPDTHVLCGDLETGLDHLAKGGVQLWPRALFTTLYLRLFVFDWFVHGIGGALYDQITEDWAKQWLHIQPNPMVAASLTMRLPLPPPRSCPEESRKAQHIQHHLHWNPDLLLDPSEKSNLHPLLDELQQLRSIDPESGPSSKSRFHRIRHLVETLRDHTKGHLEEGWAKVEQLRRFASEEHLVNSREYAFPLHPSESLQKRLQPLLHLRETAAKDPD